MKLSLRSVVLGVLAAAALAPAAVAQPSAPPSGHFAGCAWRPVAGETGLFCPAGRWWRRIDPHPDFGPRTLAKAAAGEPHAMAILGIAYRGLRWEAAIHDGERLLRAAADKDDPLALRTLGEKMPFWFADLPEPKRPEAYLRRAAEVGDPAAMTAFGNTLWDKPKEAEGWYRRAADAGHAPAMLALSTLYEMEGPLKDLAAAQRWLRAAAEAGDSGAMGLLAAHYEQGLSGVPRDVEQGKAWRARADRARAAELMRQIERKSDLVPRSGDEGPEQALAEMYLRGSDGVPRDTPRALALFRSAAENGDLRAAARLQQVYQHGWPGVAADPAEASAWAGRIKAMTLDLAVAGAETGDAWAMERLAKLYLTGDDPGSSLTAPIDVPKGLGWLEKALKANPGSAELAALMARVQREGIGVPKDPGKAQAWMNRAAAENPLSYLPIDQLAAQADKGEAIVAFALSHRTMEAGRADEAVYWYFLAVLRAAQELAAADGGSQGASTGYSALALGMGDPVKRHAAKDLPKLVATLDRVLAWDAAHPVPGASAAVRKKHRDALAELKVFARDHPDQLRRNWTDDADPGPHPPPDDRTGGPGS